MPTTRSGTVSPARTLAIDLACLVAALLVSVPILLRFGDPQWSRWVYMFQAYVHPDEPPPPPRGYTGTWRGWHRNGTLAVQVGYRNGESHGQTVSWTDGGVRRLECYYVDGYRCGPWTEWDDTGKVTVRGRYRDGGPWHGCCYLHDRKAWTAVFREGRPWAGYLWGDWGEGREERMYRNGEVVCTLRYGEPWDGLFLERDSPQALLTETRYRAGVTVASEPWSGVVLAWDDAGGAFVERRFARGVEVAPPR